jgi:FkbM family methyltransferase
VFESLHRIALTGMNYGGGTDFQISGEREALQHVKTALLTKSSRPYTLFDVGANEGGYTKLLLEVFGSDAIVYSFEPLQSTFEILCREIGRKAKLHRFALGDRNGTLPLYSCSQYSGLASLYKRNLKHFGMTLDQSEDVSVLMLDEFCRMEQLQRIHFLKLDVEGHELLERGGIDFIQFEFGGCNIDSSTYLRDFYELLTPRYRIYRIVTDGLRPVTADREVGEIFTTTNYMCELLGH